MGAAAAAKQGEICFNVRRVIATEILAACQAIDLRAGEGFKLGDGTQAAYDTVRKTNAFIAYDKDIEMFKELERLRTSSSVVTSLKPLKIRQTSSSS